MKVTFDEEQDKGRDWVCHCGTLTRDGKDYPFAVLATAINLDPTFEIAWTEDEPKEKQKAERSIIEHFTIADNF